VELKTAEIIIYTYLSKLELNTIKNSGT